MLIQVDQQIDELGEPEVFTWDLFPLVEAQKTAHLYDEGLPRLGTRITPGMIIIGKIAKTRDFDPNNQPNAVEKHTWTLDELRETYGAMWKDTSVYATRDTSGIVSLAMIVQVGDRFRAVVELRPEAAR